MIPPSGRTAKPIPSVANANSVPESGSLDGKNASLNLLGRCAVDRVPGGDFFEMWVADGRVPLGQGDLR
jgi:hypothetical protein